MCKLSIHVLLAGGPFFLEISAAVVTGPGSVSSQYQAMAPTRCKCQRSRLLRWWYCTDCGTRVAKKWTYCPACGVILHLPRPQSDDSASANDAAPEGYDERASGHGGSEMTSRGTIHSSSVPGEGGRKDAIEAWRPARGTSEDSRGRSRSRR